MFKTTKHIILWLWILLFVIAMYISLPYSKAIVVDIYHSLGWKHFNYLILAIFFALYLAIHRYIRFTFKTAIITMIIAVIIFVAYFKTRFPTDRLHLIIYMILGFSIYKAVSHEVKNNYLKFILSLAFVMAIGLEDEILQSYLPNRDMELSDLFRDFLGGLAGVLLGMIAENGKNKQVKKKLTNPRK